MASEATAIALPRGWGHARLYPGPEAVPGDARRTTVRAYDASGRVLTWRPDDDVTDAACDVERADTSVAWMARRFGLPPAGFLAHWVCSETRAKLERRSVHDLVARRGLVTPPPSGAARADALDGSEILYLAIEGLHLALGRRRRSHDAR